VDHRWGRERRRRTGRRGGILAGCALVLLAAVGAPSLGLADNRSSEPAAARMSVATSLPQGLEWRNIGPLRGSRSIAAAGSPSRPNEYYFGATGGGLWKTSDGGTTWDPVTDGQLTSSSVGAVAVCEANPDVVYAGTGEVQFRENIIQGDGVYRSTDGGQTWTHLGLQDTQTISRIRIDPNDCNRVYAAAMGHPFSPNTDRGVFRSTDGGETWERVLYQNSQTGAADLAMDPGNPGVLYAGMWHAFMRPWGGRDAGTGSGIYKSTDGGDTWTDLTRNPGLPDGLIGKVGVAVSGADSNRLYAIISSANDPGLYRSDDAGHTWAKINDHGNLRARPHYYTRVAADPRDRDTVYVLTDDLSKSTDGGTSFEEIDAPHGDHHDLWIDPNDPRRMINSNDGGANVTLDGGQTWTDQDFSTAQMYGVTTTNDVPYLVCGGQQENDTACVPSDGAGGEFFSVGGGESAIVASDPRDSNVFYAGNYGGTNLTRFDRALPFQRRRIDVWPEIPFGHAPKELRERFAWSVPIVTTPAFPNAVYTSSQHLFRTTNEGQSWERISPDLTRAVPATMELPFGPIYHHPNSSYTYATISAVAPSGLDRSLIWVGSDDGLVHVSRNGGRTWSDVTPPDMRRFTYVSKIEASPHDPGTAYVAAHRYKLEDRAPYIYKTDDYGRSWTKSVDGIPDGDFVRAVREDPARKGLLYAGTEHGIYVSFDDGARWESLRQNLPDTQVRDLVVKDEDLVIATFGRGFWIMDDITPLRGGATVTADPPPTAGSVSGPQAFPAPARQRQGAGQPGSSFQLFDPLDPIRLVDPGVRVEYSLSQPAQEVSLEFLDRRGNLIRSFTGAQVPTTPGQHSFLWNLRYPGPTLFDGLVITFASTNGPRAPWGRYSVRLTVDGESQTQSFEIKGDPRLRGVGPGQIREQFRLAMRVRDRTSDANEGVIAIRACRDQVDDRLDRSDDEDVTSAGERLAEALGVIERALYQTELVPGVSWEGVEPLRLNNEIAYLLAIIESAESRPTDQTYAVFDLLSRRLDRRLADLDGLFDEEVPAFNELLRAHDLEPIDCSRGGGG
jgi:photosystem II stability/assembly factor-like uncharacterized protein